MKKYLSLVLILLFIGCSTAKVDNTSQPTKKKNFIQKTLNPDWLSGKPLWKKMLWWIGPGH